MGANTLRSATYRASAWLMSVVAVEGLTLYCNIVWNKITHEWGSMPGTELHAGASRIESRREQFV
jgi:hypothetical protein